MRSLMYFVSTCCYTGLSPIAPGTAGSLFALIVLIPISFLTGDRGVVTLMLIAVISTLAGLIASDYAALKIFHHKDPREIVIDEFAGMSISVCLFPFRFRFEEIFLWGLAFIVFRLLDIVKPFFIYNLQNFKGGWGIMLDDVAAGVLTLLSLLLVKFFLF